MAQRPETAVERYKRAHGLTYPQLARLWRMSENTLRKWGCGMRVPTPKRAVRIEKLSKGEITKEELVFGAQGVAA